MSLKYLQQMGIYNCYMETKRHQFYGSKTFCGQIFMEISTNLALNIKQA